MSREEENAERVLKYLQAAFARAAVYSRYDDARDRWEFAITSGGQARTVVFTWEALLSPSHVLRAYLDRHGPALVERLSTSPEEIVVGFDDLT
jgi:hypothetical protein